MVVPEEGSLQGTTVGHYRFDELLGSGATADVYRAHDLRLQRDVAIKAINPEILADPEKAERTLKEARIHARLEHVNIVRIYDLLQDGKRLFLVMRYLRGRSLAGLMQAEGGRLDHQDVLGYLDHVLRGVGFAHSMGVVHLDLKPQNIQITPAGEALVMDFGIARLSDERPDERESHVAGSPAYMAPEQIRGEYTDARADIYALGIALYQLLTARHPFTQARTVMEMLAWQTKRMPAPPSTVDASLPMELDEVVMRAISKDPADRYRSCAEFANALGLQVPVAKDEKDVRWDPRVRYRGRVRMLSDGGMAFVQARCINISAGGMAIFSNITYKRGAKISLEWLLPGQLERGPMQARAEVAWVHEEQETKRFRIGLRFTSIKDEYKQRLSDFIREVMVLGEEAERTR